MPLHISKPLALMRAVSSHEYPISLQEPLVPDDHDQSSALRDSWTPCLLECPDSDNDCVASAPLLGDDFDAMNFDFFLPRLSDSSAATSLDRAAPCSPVHSQLMDDGDDAIPKRNSLDNGSPKEERPEASDDDECDSLDNRAIKSLKGKRKRSPGRKKNSSSDGETSSRESSEAPPKKGRRPLKVGIDLEARKLAIVDRRAASMEQHRLSEKQRRQEMNASHSVLRSLLALPETAPVTVVLERAVEYIRQLQDDEQQLQRELAVARLGPGPRCD
jgi:hypothetical protein